MKPNQTITEKLAMPFAAFIFIVILWAMTTTANAQSFQPYRSHHSLQSPGHIKTKTIGQKLHTKIKYAKKRHHSERFAFREMRRRSKAGQI